MAGEPTPTVRVSHCQATLRTLRAEAPLAVEPVLARLPAEARERILAATPVHLVPAEWDVALVLAITEELGVAATRELARRSMLENLRGPLLGSFLAGTLRLFGTRPGRILSWAGRVWSHVTSSCGELRLEEAGEDTAVLVLEGMPARLAVPAYLDAVAGTLESIFIVCKVEGQVAVAHRPDGARFSARWRPDPDRRAR